MYQVAQLYSLNLLNDSASHSLKRFNGKRMHPKSHSMYRVHLKARVVRVSSCDTECCWWLDVDHPAVVCLNVLRGHAALHGPGRQLEVLPAVPGLYGLQVGGGGDGDLPVVVPGESAGCHDDNSAISRHKSAGHPTSPLLSTKLNSQNMQH